MIGPEPSRGGERNERIHMKADKKEMHQGKCMTRICRRKEEEHVRLSS
jgi:hypothetical protein